MKQSQLNAFAVDRRLALLPHWVLQREHKVVVTRDRVRLKWYCTRTDKVCHVDHYLRSGAQPRDEEVAASFATKLQERHPQCGPRADDSDSVPIATELRDMARNATQQKEVVRGLKRNLTQVEVENEHLHDELESATEARTALSKLKQQATRSKNRRLDIDPENKEQLNVEDRSTAMTAPNTGMFATVKYWARGSAAIVLQLIMSLIVHFGLQQEVPGKLDLKLEEPLTNKCIVSRARAALDILKQCDSEQQRREYRIVLTALMPEGVKKAIPLGCKPRWLQLLESIVTEQPFERVWYGEQRLTS